jgi:polygalacturonase
MNYSPLIYAYQQENVSISGNGILDGQADTNHWWPWKGSATFGWKPGEPTEAPDFATLQLMATNNVPVSERIFGAGHYLPPPFVEFYRCENVAIEDVTIMNSPFWQMHPTLSHNVLVRNVTVNSLGPNNDGCDPESCDNVVIYGCTFNTGDDCIAIKAGRDADGRRVNTPSQNIVIEHCHFQNGHGGVTVGSEMTGGVRNVFARHLTMTSPILQSGLRIKTNSQRGGFVEDIYLDDISITQLSQAGILIDFNYDVGAGYGFNPTVKNINVQHLTVGQTVYALDMAGYVDDPIQGVHLDDCTFTVATKPSIVQYVNDLTFHNVVINGTKVG